MEEGNGRLAGCDEGCFRNHNTDKMNGAVLGDGMCGGESASNRAPFMSAVKPGSVEDGICIEKGRRRQPYLIEAPECSAASGRFILATSVSVHKAWGLEMLPDSGLL